MTGALQYLWLNVQTQFFKDLRYYFTDCSFVLKQALKTTQIYKHFFTYTFSIF